MLIKGVPDGRSHRLHNLRGVAPKIRRTNMNSWAMVRKEWCSVHVLSAAWFAQCSSIWPPAWYYDQTSNISRIESQYCKISLLVLQLSLPNPSLVLSREWRYPWSSADKRCSDYIWVINNLIVRRAGLMRSQQDFEWWWSVPLSSASLY